MYNKIQKQLNKTKLKTEADVVTHRYNPNTVVAEAGGWKV